MIYAIYALCGLSLLQCVALIVLMKRRKGMDAGRIETRLSHFGEALALLTDTTQSGFNTVAAELERMSGGRVPAINRAATSKRIVGAARKGRTIQEIAAAEEVSESEIRLTLGIATAADEPVTAKKATTDAAAVTAPVVEEGSSTTTRTRAPRQTRKVARPEALPAVVAAVATPAPAAVSRPVKPAAMPAVVHEQARRPRARVVGHSLNVGA